MAVDLQEVSAEDVEPGELPETMAARETGSGTEGEPGETPGPDGIEVPMRGEHGPGAVRDGIGA